MSTTDGLVTVETAGAVSSVVLNRADRANAMDSAMFQALREALERVAADASTNVVVLRGNGAHFCAGGDLAHPLFSDDDAARRREQIEEAYVVTNCLLDFPVPIVCVAHGRCAGAGLALVLASDVRIVAPDATFSIDFARLGLAPDMGLAWLLRQNVPLGPALHLTMTAEVFGAAEAHRLGLATRIADPDCELAEGMDVARRIAGFPRQGPASVRQLLRGAANLDRHAAFEKEVDVMTDLSASPHAREQLEAFRTRQRRSS